MATRGRKPAPIELKLLKGNPGKRPINAKASVLQQPEALAEDAAPGMLLSKSGRARFLRQPGSGPSSRQRYTKSRDEGGRFASEL